MNDSHARDRRRFKISIGLLDTMLALLSIGAIFLLAKNSLEDPALDAVQAATEAADPWLSLALIVPAIPILAFVLAISTKLDRRCSEDYVFQLASSAALVATTGTIFVYAVWELAADLITGLRPSYGDDLIGILILCWSTGWFTFRARGLTT